MVVKVIVSILIVGFFVYEVGVLISDIVKKRKAKKQNNDKEVIE